MDDPDWSQLPSDLIIGIADKLRCYSDYVRFRGVCSVWRSSVPAAPRHQFPWLMFSPPKEANNPPSGRRRGFYDPLSRKIHFLNLPEASHPRRICCSSRGWLLVLEEGPRVFCLNPLSKAKVPLPPLSSFPNVTSFDFCNVGREYTLLPPNLPRTRNLNQMRDSFLKKIVLSDSPSAPRFVALSILCDTGELAYCNKGDASWKSIPGTNCFYEDAIYSNGSFYALASTGHLSLIHLPPHPTTTTTAAASPVIHTLTPSFLGLGGAAGAGLVGDLQYLVHSGDRLLLVCRHLELDHDSVFEAYQTTSFEVYTLNDRQPIPTWDKLHAVETHVIFLGNNTSFSLPVSDDLPGSHHANRVYFTDDHSHEYNYDHVTPPRCYDMGIFNFKDDTIQKMPYFVQRSSTAFALPAAPIWVSPNPC